MSRRFMQNMIQIIITVLFFNLMAPVFAYAGTPANIILHFGGSEDDDYGALISKGSLGMPDGTYTISWHPEAGSMAGPAVTNGSIHIAAGGSAPFKFAGSPDAVDGAKGTLDFVDASSSAVTISAIGGLELERFNSFKAASLPARLVPVENISTGGSALQQGFGANYYYDSDNVLHMRNSWTRAVSFSLIGNVKFKVEILPAGVNSTWTAISLSDSVATNSGIGACVFGRVPSASAMGYQWKTANTDEFADGLFSQHILAADGSTLNNFLSDAIVTRQHTYFVFDKATSSWYSFGFSNETDQYYETNHPAGRISDKIAVAFGDGRDTDTVSLFASSLPAASALKASWFIGNATEAAVTSADFGVSAAGATAAIPLGSSIGDSSGAGILAITSGASVIYALKLDPNDLSAQTAYLEANAPMGAFRPVNASHTVMSDASGGNYRMAAGLLTMKESWAKAAAYSERINLRAESSSGQPIDIASISSGALMFSRFTPVTGSDISSAVYDNTSEYPARILTGGALCPDASGIGRFYYYDAQSGMWTKAQYTVQPDASYGGSVSDYFSGFLPDFGTADEADRFALCGLPTASVPDGYYEISIAVANSSGGVITPQSIFIKNGNAGFISIPCSISIGQNQQGDFLLRHASGEIAFSGKFRTTFSSANRQALDAASMTAYAMPAFMDAFDMAVHYDNPGYANYRYRIDGSGVDMRLAWAAGLAVTPAGIMNMALYTDSAKTASIDMRSVNAGERSLEFLEGGGIPTRMISPDAVSPQLYKAVIATAVQGYTGYVFNSGSSEDFHWYRFGYDYKTAFDLQTGEAVTVAGVSPANGSSIDAKSGLATAVIGGKTLPVVAITYSVANGVLQFGGLDRLKACNVSPSGIAGLVIDSAQMTDANIPDLYKATAGAAQATVYIPILSLLPGLAYLIDVPIGIVVTESAGKTVSSPSYSWNFKTFALPSLSGGVWPASFEEDYDSTSAVNITGKFETVAGMEVYFGGIQASSLSVSISPNAVTAYLPRGSARLVPGVYDIELKFQGKTIKRFSGGLSIVRSGEIFPDSESLLDTSHSEGDLSQERKTSADTLYLTARYSQKDFLELDMDDLFGADTVLRRIIFDLASGDRVLEIKLHSKWYEIIIKDFKRQHDSSQDAMLSVSRVIGTRADSLRQSLRNRPLESEFIQIKADGAKNGSFSISLPLNTEARIGTKAIRYDDNTRTWSLARSFILDEESGNMVISDDKPGIFVIVN